MENEIKIIVFLYGDKIKTATNYKYLIADTIEERGIGEVINEGIFLEEKKIELIIEADANTENIEEIKSLLLSLGIGRKDYLICID